MRTGSSKRVSGEVLTQARVPLFSFVSGGTGNFKSFLESDAEYYRESGFHKEKT